MGREGKEHVEDTDELLAPVWKNMKTLCDKAEPSYLMDAEGNKIFYNKKKKLFCEL